MTLLEAIEQTRLIVHGPKCWTKFTLRRTNLTPENPKYSYCLFGAFNQATRNNPFWGGVEDTNAALTFAKTLNFKSIDEAIYYNNDEKTTFNALRSRLDRAIKKLHKHPKLNINI
jgi:hypothetical protein